MLGSVFSGSGPTSSLVFSIGEVSTVRICGGTRVSGLSGYVALCFLWRFCLRWLSCHTVYRRVLQQRLTMGRGSDALCHVAKHGCLRVLLLLAFTDHAELMTNEKTLVLTGQKHATRTVFHPRVPLRGESHGEE